MSSQVLAPTTMVYNNDNTATTTTVPFRNPLQQRKDIDRRVLHLNNRACVLVLSNGEYSEAIKLFDTALMIHKEQTEEGSNNIVVETTPATTNYCPQHEGCDIHDAAAVDFSCHSSSDHIYDDDCEDEIDEDEDHDFSEEDISETDFDEDFMDWDDDSNKVNNKSINHHHHNLIDDIEDDVDTSSSSIDYEEEYPIPVTTAMHYPQQPATPLLASTTTTTTIAAKIPRMTTASRLRTLNYCGQEEYHSELGLQSQHHYHHQVYSLPIVMEESEWDTAPVQDKTFVLIFNTALCNHLWGMQLMQQYIAATTSNSNNNNNTTSSNNNNEAVAALAEHCRETLTIAKLLYKLALENSVSFANGVDKMCYVALYNNLSHVLKTLEGYDSAEAQWCDDMLLKAIFWWRDSTNHHSNSNSNSGHQNSSSSSSNRSSSSHSHPSTGSHSNNNNSNSLSDMYLDDDADIIDAFLENVYYRVGVPENIVPAAAA